MEESIFDKSAIKDNFLTKIDLFILALLNNY